MKSLETFYEQCIESKIVQCELKARANGRSYCSRKYAEQKQALATFFEDRKERLIQEMVKENLGMDLSRINSFLNLSFFLAFPTKHYYSNNSEDIGLSPDYYPRDEASIRKMREPLAMSSTNCLSQEHLAKLYEPAWSDGSLIADEDDECL